MITTFNQRIIIPAIMIDDQRFSFRLDGHKAHYAMLALSFLISVLVVFGRLIEAHQEVMTSETRIITLYFVVRIFYGIYKQGWKLELQ